MIDFRYHLVSLIAVFLALAVGIVLGAGPLRDTIGDTLTGQVQDLRADRDRLRGELAAAETDAAERTTYLEDSAPVLLAGTLADRSVSLVTLPGTSEDDVQAVRDRLAQTGARLVSQVAVTDAWTDPKSQSFRQTFAGQMLGYLAPAPAADASTESIFGLALAHALTDGEGGAFTPNASTLLDLLTSADAPLVSVTTEPSGPADATILVGPRAAEQPAEDVSPKDSDAAKNVLASRVQLAEALATVSGSVTVGAAASDLDLVGAVRADDGAAGVVTTVDSVGEITAAISTPLAVAVALSGGHDHYGFERGAVEAVPPRVELAPAAPASADAGQPSTEEPATDGAA
ncbi:copper transporter [Georgenia sp. SYP-B2076]|uniref:copper transporter n=1 Tax=Georgenia sp. SYP-B2076 TaxID=2495881 RepID=UPI000F8E37C8|nr:copper transporter [Georgenia sp. SYP-B2076]